MKRGARRDSEHGDRVIRVARTVSGSRVVPASGLKRRAMSLFSCSGGGRADPDVSRYRNRRHRREAFVAAGKGVLL